ncbi:MAG: 4-(cytidine 5'-diphospho)-2-C-methyl-D-erythritol kinase [Clostridiaceae bacterium]|nr:4-(cytidine 5'-diphospho)-2-C-methyl-D-erythritol kinase [Clostridiaceae bacterium]
MTEFPPCRSTESARAKINLSLHVLGRRPDDYHELAGVMATVDLADRLDIGLRRVTEKDTGWEFSSDSGQLPAGEANLCFKAAYLFFDATGIAPQSLHFYCHIDKRIPMAAGLGGGSADAAAVLRFLWMCWQGGLAESFQLDRRRLSMDQLDHLALACGADVPFCLHGGIRFCQGVGERVSNAIESLSHPVLLAFPPFPVRTADAFRLLDTRRLDQGDRLAPGRQAGPDFAWWSATLERDDRPGIGAMACNDFLEIQADQSIIRLILEGMRDAGAFAASMTGSGPACFALFNHEKDREKAFRTLTAKYPEVNWMMTSLSPRPERLACQN